MKFRVFRKILVSTVSVYTNARSILCTYSPMLFRQGYQTLHKRCHLKQNRLKRSPEVAFASVGLAGVARCFLWFGKKEEENEKVLKLIKMAKLKEYSLDYKEAEELYHDALKLAADGLRVKKISEKDYLHSLNHCYNSLADLSTAQGKLQDAEKLYKECMKVLLQLGTTQTDNAIVELSVKLSSVYSMMQKFKEAESGFLFCIETQEEKRKDNPDIDNDTLAILGLALETYARFLLYTQKAYSKSEELFTKSLEIAKKVLEENHPQTLILMNDLTTSLIFQKKYDEAEKLLNHAIELGVKTNASELPALYCNLGAVYLRKSSPDEAYIACGNASHYAKNFKDMIGFEQAQKCLEKVEKLRSQRKH